MIIKKEGFSKNHFFDKKKIDFFFTFWEKWKKSRAFWIKKWLFFILSPNGESKNVIFGNFLKMVKNSVQDWSKISIFPSLDSDFSWCPKHLEPNIIFGSKSPSFSHPSFGTQKRQKKSVNVFFQKRNKKSCVNWLWICLFDPKI